MRCGLARCPAAKSTDFSIIPVVSFSHVHAISSRFNVILLIYRQAAGYPPCQHNTLDIKENNQRILEHRKTHDRFWGRGRVWVVLKMMLISNALIVAWFPDHM